MRPLIGLCSKLVGSSDPFPMKHLGENSEPDTQVSPDRLLRAALLRSRYADVIVKARGILSKVQDFVNLLSFFILY
jgi:hypothetical protein